MSSVFTAIIHGDLPGSIIYSDDVCVALLTITPHTRGHALVVPREEINAWTDAPDDLLAHLTSVAKRIGRAQLAEFGGTRSGLMIQGYGVDHLHLHVFPTTGIDDFDERARPAATATELAEVAELLIARLQLDGSNGT